MLSSLIFSSAVPTAEPNPSLGVLYPTLRQGGFVGVARFHAGAADFKAQKFPAGVYTMRYAVQPEDGDHQGVTESRDFLLLCAAASDPAIDAMELKELNKLSARVNGKKHPAVLYLVGVIASGASSFDSPGGAVTGSDTVVEWLRKVRADSSVRAIVLRIDSPGGSAVASDIIWREVMLTRAIKPVIASMGV